MSRLTRAVVALFPLWPLWLPARPAPAQAVTPTIGVYNPTPYLADWATKPGMGGLSVSNTTGFDVDLTVTATLFRSGVQVGVAGSDITVIPATAASFYTLPQVARWQQMTLQGAVAQSVNANGRLPEGAYQLCILFSNMSANGRGIVDEQGCTFFNITFPQPPKLLTPANGSNVITPYPTFQWTPVVTPAVPQVGYRLRVVEVLAGQTPQQALLANVPVFETQLNTLTTVTYPPFAYPLEAGSTYAWRVQATKPELELGQPLTPVGANNGNSEIFTFKKQAVGQVVTIAPPTGPPPGGGSGGGYAYNPPVFNRSLTGRIDYVMHASLVPAPKRLQPFTALTYPLMQYGPGGTPPPPNLPPSPMGTTGGGTGTVSGALPSSGTLAGVTVRLVVRYRSGIAPVNAATVHVGPKTYSDVGKVLATATTDANGNFTFAFHDDGPTGQIAFFQPVSWGSGDIGQHVEASGTLFRYYNVDVEDAHYLSPSDELTVPASGQGEAGRLVALARTYSLVIRLLDAKSKQVLQAVPVRLVRRNRPGTVPEFEGNAPTPRLRDTVFVFGQKVIGDIVANGATATTDGTVRFQRLVKNAGPGDAYVIRAFTAIDQPGLYYFPVSQSYANAWAFKPGGGFVQKIDNAHYNEQYTPFTDTLTIYMQPRAPRIAGRVFRADSAAPIRNGSVLVMRNNYPVALHTLVPRDAGRFAIENLPPAPVEPTYKVAAVAPGFLAMTKSAPLLGLGKQWYAEWLLVPDARIVARFVNELGQAVHASIKVGDGPHIVSKGMDYKATGGFGNFQMYGPTAWGVDTLATSGPNLKVHIEAEPDHFSIDTVLTLHKGLNNLGTFVLQRRLHHVRVRVVRGNPSGGLTMAGAPPVPGAHVQRDQAQQTAGSSGTTGSDGTVVLWWPSAGGNGAADSTANLLITGPANQDWVPQGRTCSAPEKPEIPTCVVYLRPGTRVTGVVYEGPGTDKPVAGARVHLPDYEGIEAKTNNQGAYDLRSVPRWVKTVRAAQAGSGLIGEDVAVNLTGATATGVDFHLKPGNGLATLYGFPLEIASSTPAPSGDGFIVSGAVAALPNPAYAPVDAGGTPQPGIALPFDQALLRPAAGDPSAAVPDGDALTLATGELKLGLLGAYRATQRGPLNQLQIRDRGQGQGAVYGPVELLRQQSFQGTSSTGLSFVDAQGADAPLFLLQPGATGAARTTLATLTADAANPTPQTGVNVGSAAGGPAHFRLAAKQGGSGFQVDADPAQSFVRADGVRFRATLHTAIAGIGDLQLVVPELLVQPGSGGIGAASTDTITAQLDQWTLKAPAWSISDAGLFFAKGEIRAPIIPGKPSSAVVFPFTGMELLPTGFQGGTIQSNAVTLGGIVNLVPDGALHFEREGLGPWKLWAQGGTISGLPAWAPNDEITLDNWSLRSNGDNHFTTAPDTLRLYHTADFEVGGLGVVDGGVTFIGQLDLLAPPEGHIPKLGVNVYYTKNAQGQVTFGMDQATWPEIEIGGAYLAITGGQLDASGFHAGGHIRVPNYFTVPTNFSRTPLNGSNKIEAVPTADATIPIGAIALTQLKGGAHLASPWSTAFQSILNIPNEVNGPVSFNVGGAGVTVGTAGLTVKNIATPFGNMAMTLNMPEQRLEGSVELNQQLAAGATATGTAQLAISGKPSNRYWYFFAGANFQLSSPSLGGTAALVIGNATLSGDLLSDFASYSTKGVPPSFYTINGFFLDGKIVVPIPSCPSGGVDVGVASVAVWCDMWGDLRLGMNFHEQNVYHIGIQAGADVGAKGAFSLGACVSVSGKASYEQGAEGEYRSDGAWYVLGDAAFNLHGEVEFGVGAFGVCLSKSKGFNLGLGAEAQLGHNWNTGQGPHFRVYWK